MTYNEASGATLQRLVGRKTLIARLAQSLQAQRPLTTLWGAAGVGKSWIVREFLRQNPDQAARTSSVDLARIKAGEDTRQQLETLLKSCESGNTDILWIDNADHHLALLRELIGAQPSRGAKKPIWLLTSREHLELDHESLIQVKPLATHEAKTLYFNLICGVSPDFECNAQIEARVEAAVRCLGGNPLMIKFAASRVLSIPPDMLLKQWPRVLGKLAMRHTPDDPRHRSAMAALQWSWDALQPELRRILQQCALFNAAFSLSAAHAVLGEHGQASEVSDHLEALTRKSLLHQSMQYWSNGEMGFELDPIVRAFLAVAPTSPTEDAALLGADELQQLRRRHLAYFTRPCTRLLGSARPDNTREALKRVVLYARDIEAGAAHCVQAGRDEAAAAPLLALDRVRRCGGPAGDVEGLIETVLSRADNTLGDTAHSDLLAARAESLKRQGKLREASTHWTQALARAAGAGDSSRQIALHLRLAESWRLRSKPESAWEHLDKSAALLSAAEPGPAQDALRRCYLSCLASCQVDAGQLDQARATLAKVVALPSHPDIFTEFECLRTQIYAQFHLREEPSLSKVSQKMEAMVDDLALPRLRASYLRLMGDQAFGGRQLAKARDLYTQALRIFERLGEPFMRTVLTGSLGGIALLSHDFETARAHYSAAIALGREFNNHTQTAGTLLGLGTIEHARGQHRAAETCYRETSQLLESTGGSTSERAWCAMVRGWNAGENRPDKGIEILENAVEICGEFEHQTPAYIAQCSLAIAHLRVGNTARADALFDDASAHIRLHRTSGYALYFSILEHLRDLYRGDAGAIAAAKSFVQRLDDPTGDCPAQFRTALNTSFTSTVLLSWLRREVARRTPEKKGPRLVVDRTKAWFYLDDGEHVDLTRRKTLHAIFAALVEQQRTTDGQALHVDALFQIGWPGTDILHESARNRVYWVIYSLRNLGLDPWLETCGDGYRLAPHLTIEIAP